MGGGERVPWEGGREGGMALRCRAAWVMLPRNEGPVAASQAVSSR